MSPDPLDIEQTSIRDKKSAGYTLKAGAKFGEYRIVRPLGRGGMGEVYEVEHQTLHRRYALKLLPENFARQAGALERFEREAQVMANLDHPNILKVDDFRETEGRYWLRMELAGGQYSGVRSQNSEGEQRPAAVSLQDLAEAKGGRIPQEELVGILKQILEGLAYAHGRGVIHRDLKPSNILLFSGRDGAPRRPGSDGKAGPPDPPEETARAAPAPYHVKIADFGLVRLVGEGWVRSQADDAVHRSMTINGQTTRRVESAGTSTQSLLGTYEYMSPEQKSGEEATEQSDLYAVGLMGYRLLTGRTLSMKTPSQIVPSLDKRWDDWLAKGLEEEISNRWTSASEMAAHLAEIADAPPERAGGKKRGIRKNKRAPQNEWEAAAAGDAVAQNDVGWKFQHGIGVNVDYAEALKWYQLSANQGNASAQNNWGWMCEMGKGVAQDYKAAANLYRCAAIQGLAVAQNNLAYMYYLGRGVEQDDFMAATWFRRAAEQGAANAQYMLGTCSKTGKGVEKDPERAGVLFRKAAEQGHAVAQYELAECMFTGEGVPQNQAEAVQWYAKSAAQGNADAQNALGNCYYSGTGVAQDRAQAAQCFRIAAGQGHAWGQYNLANCLYAGEGVLQNQAEAVQWYAKSAAQGNADAQNDLGNCYYSGTGVAQDRAQAAQWYRKAAEQGHAWGQYNLANCLSAGEGVQPDKAEAKSWYQKAANQGNDKAREILREFDRAGENSGSSSAPPDVNNPSWRKDGDGFRLWSSGQPIIVSVTRWDGPNLIATNADSREQFLLPNFAEAEQGKWHIARRLDGFAHFPERRIGLSPQQLEIVLRAQAMVAGERWLMSCKIEQQPSQAGSAINGNTAVVLLVTTHRFVVASRPGWRGRAQVLSTVKHRDVARYHFRAEGLSVWMPNGGLVRIGWGMADSQARSELRRLLPLLAKCTTDPGVS